MSVSPSEYRCGLCSCPSEGGVACVLSLPVKAEWPMRLSVLMEGDESYVSAPVKEAWPMCLSLPVKGGMGYVLVSLSERRCGPCVCQS